MIRPPPSIFPQLANLPPGGAIDMAAFRAMDAAADVAAELGREMGMPNSDVVGARIASALRHLAIEWLGERTIKQTEMSNV